MTVVCAQCGDLIAMSEVQEQRYRSTGATFHCLHGHSNYYPQGPTKEVKQLREEVAFARKMLRNVREMRDELYEDREAFRLERRTCPLCGHRARTRQSMVRHLEATHVAPREPLQLEAKTGAAQ